MQDFLHREEGQPADDEGDDDDGHGAGCLLLLGSAPATPRSYRLGGIISHDTSTLCKSEEASE